MRLAALISFAVGMLGCHHARPAAPLYGGTPGSPGGSWAEDEYPMIDAAAITAGLRPLRLDTLPPGHREIRIWRGGGFVAPYTMYRITDDGHVRGEIVRYWTRYPEDTLSDVASFERGQCTDFRRRDTVVFRSPLESNTCRALFERRPDWHAVLRRIERQGVWTLEDPSTLPVDPGKPVIVVTDGWGFTVELRDGAAYRAYQYDNPDSHPEWPHASNALRIHEVLRGVDSLTIPPGQVYHGITSGVYGSAFTECGTGRVWEFGSALEDRWKVRARDTARRAGRTDTLYEVRLRGVPRRSDRTLDVIQTLSVREARPGGC